MMPTGFGSSLGFAEDCAEPQDVSGRWIGEYTCDNLCGGEEYMEGPDTIDLTVAQSGGTAFNHLGLGPGYYEWGTTTRTGPTTATKSSTWIEIGIPNCGGTYSDTLNLYEIPD